MLYSCVEKKETNQNQLALVKKQCQNEETCQIEASREFFVDSECSGTKDADMELWLIYSCNGGGSDKTTTHVHYICSHRPSCDTGTGKMTQLAVRGCGGWVKLDCCGGSLNIHKVLNHRKLLTNIQQIFQIGPDLAIKYKIPANE